MVAFRNRVSYSPSQDALLKECELRFFFKQYLMWGGWYGRNKKPVSKEAEETYVAKFASSAASFAGTVVHQTAVWALRNAKRTRMTKVNMAELCASMHVYAKSKIDAGLRQATTQKVGNPKKRVQLIEVQIGVPIDEHYIRTRVHDRINSLCADDDAWTTMGGNVFKRALLANERIVAMEKLEEHTFGNMPSFLSIDLMMRSVHASDSCVVIDWKTGRPSTKDEEQIEFYAEFAFDRNWNDVMTMLVYLGDETSTVVHVDRPDRRTARRNVLERVDNYSKRIASKLVDGDLEANVPVRSAFKPTDNPRNCKFCPFQIQCQRDGTKPK